MKKSTQQRIQKLHAKISDIEIRIQKDRGLQEDLRKQIQDLEDADILSVVKAAGLSSEKVRKELQLLQKLRAEGLLDGLEDNESAADDAESVNNTKEETLNENKG